MGGFSANTNNQPSGSDVVFASNVDFSGATNPSSTITTNGQLLIGTTAVNVGNTHINVGTLTSPDASITIGYSSPNITLQATAGSHDLHTARYIVSSGGFADGANYTSIAAAYAAAVGATAPQTVFIQPGTYTENISLVAGIDISAYTCDGLSPNVIINGKFTLATAGTVALSGLNFQTNSDFSIVASGSAASGLWITNCYFNTLNNTSISYTTSNASSFIRMIECQGNIATTGISLFAQSSSGIMSIRKCHIDNSGATLTASTCSAGNLNIYHSILVFPITTSSTCILDCGHSTLDTKNTNATTLTHGGSTSSIIFNSIVTSGSGSSISVSSTLIASNLTIKSTNTNAITGAGTIQYGGFTFSDSSSLINTTTQTPLVRSNDAIKITTPGAYPYTTVPQDGLIKVDTSSARTITPLASPTTGQRHIIKDTVGSAAANNITVTPSGKNIDGAASYTINVNYGSITIVYNGTEWSVV